MLADALERSNPSSASPGFAELLCLIRLQEIALAAPPPVVALRSMVDALMAVPGVFRAIVVVAGPREGQVSYVAHVGKKGLRSHAPHVQTASPLLNKALRGGELVQLARSDGGDPHNCVNVPVRGLSEVLGVLGIGITPAGPLEAWREQFVWSVAELMALPLLGAELPAGPRKNVVERLTARQQEALFHLVEYSDGNAAIGDRLQLSARTVKIHLLAAYRKLGVRGRAEAIRAVLTEHHEWLARQRWLRGRPARGR